MTARAQADALRTAVADDRRAHIRYTAGSFRQMVKAGHRYAMVPLELVDRAVLELVLDELIDTEFYADGRHVCGCLYVDAAITDGTVALVAWVCLADDCVAQSPDWPTVDPDGGHGWPDFPGRTIAAAALLEQCDPVARIERRALMALEGPSAFDHLAGVMPTA